VLLHSRRTAGYRELSPSRLSSYLMSLPDLTTRLGDRPTSWKIEQVRDNDMNLVMLVEGPGGGLCVKQAVPSVMIGGETIAVPVERSIFEEAALTLLHRLAPGCVPEILHFDSEQFLLVTELLGGHRNLRKALIEGRCFPKLAEQAGGFLARSLFATSALGMAEAERRERVAFFAGNGEMREITEQLIFAGPFGWSGDPSWTSPELDGEVRAIRGDAELKRRVADLKLKFVSAPEALLHGDLHTGSLMVRDDDLKVIDFEFAQFGPIGFDIGLLLGNLLIAYFSQGGHAGGDDSRDEVEEWLLEAVERTWTVFHYGFLELWRGMGEGEALPAALFEGPGGRDHLRLMQRDYMRRIFEDALRFAGLVILRRILGVRPVIDLTSIAVRDRRATAERCALLLARELVKDAHHVDDMAEVTAAARQIRNEAAA
jgi:5-methylthioribose kinase